THFNHVFLEADLFIRRNSGSVIAIHFETQFRDASCGCPVLEALYNLSINTSSTPFRAYVHETKVGIMTVLEIGLGIAYTRIARRHNSPLRFGHEQQGVR